MMNLLAICSSMWMLLGLAFAANDSADFSHWIEHIVPENYNKLHHPTYHLWRKNISEPTIIYFDFQPRHVMSVEPKTMDFVVDLTIYMRWIDGRLSIPEEIKAGGVGISEIPKAEAEKLWTPSIYLTNCKACNDYLADSEDQRLKLYTNKNAIRIKFTKMYKFTCAIDLRNYPFDAQDCKVRIEKYGRIMQLPFYEHYIDDIPIDDINVPPEFALTGIKWHNCSEQNIRWLECIEFVFHFRRMIANHVMLVFIPSMLIVILSWISFWLDAEVAAPRVALGLTSLLTLATQLNNSQRNLPPVSAIKAVDIWMFSCMFMVFGSLIEFAAANSLARRKKNTAKVAPVIQINNITKNLPPNVRRRTVGKQIVCTRRKSAASIMAKHPSPIDFVARIAFPTAFYIFNLVFWGYFATKDQ